MPQDVKSVIKEALQEIAPQIKEKIAEEVKAEILKELQVPQTQTKQNTEDLLVKAYQEKNFDLLKQLWETTSNTELKMGILIKALVDGEHKAIGEGPAPDGGVLVPTQFIPQLLEKVATYGTIRKLVTIMNVTLPTGTLPKETQDPEVVWLDEGQQIPEKSPSFDTVKWALRKVGALVRVSRDLLQDTPINIARLLEKAFARAIAKNEDKIFLTNSDSDLPLGIVPQVPAANTIDASDKVLDYTHLVELVRTLTLVDADFYRNASFVVSPRGMEAIYKIRDANGNPIFVQNPQRGGVGTIFGFPVFVSRAMLDAEGTDDNGNYIASILFGDFSQAILFQQGEMSINVSQHAYFEYDQVAFRIIHRKDFQVAYPEAFALLKAKVA